MRILWITNIPTPMITRDMGRPEPVGGGWISELSKAMSNEKDLDLIIAFPDRTIKDEGRIGNLSWYSIMMDSWKRRPIKDACSKLEEVISRVEPDIIHIWGTEYVHSYSTVCACVKLGLQNRVIVSIQGLVSVYALHFYGYINSPGIRLLSLYDILKRSTPAQERNSFKKRGIYEKKTIKNVMYVMGRTDWDKACTWFMNPKAKYYFCNEVLRKSFYTKKWNLQTCKRHSIFVSQSSSPLKGLHIVLQSLSLILSKYPDTVLYTTGENKLASDLKHKLKQRSYDRYIAKLIKKENLSNHVVFTGFLDEAQMCRQFCASHVFVSASSIENSPNSVGEAMLLGVPTVTSDVGGVKNMLDHGKDGFIYPADEPYMLAYYVCRIFEDDSLALAISESAKMHGRITHDITTNVNTLIACYKDMLQS